MMNYKNIGYGIMGKYQFGICIYIYILLNGNFLGMKTDQKTDQTKGPSTFDFDFDIF